MTRWHRYALLAYGFAVLAIFSWREVLLHIAGLVGVKQAHLALVIVTGIALCIALHAAFAALRGLLPWGTSLNRSGFVINIAILLPLLALTAWATFNEYKSFKAFSLHPVFDLEPGTFDRSDERELLQYTGFISSIFPQRLKHYVTTGKPIRHLEITSSGGFMEAAEVAAELANSHNLTVVVYDKCLSACVALFALADQRETTPGAVFAMHSPFDVDHGTIAYRDDYEYLWDRMLAIGFPENFVTKAAATPYDKVEVISGSQLVAAKVAMPANKLYSFNNPAILEVTGKLSERDALLGGIAIQKLALVGHKDNWRSVISSFGSTRTSYEHILGHPATWIENYAALESVLPDFSSDELRTDPMADFTDEAARLEGDVCESLMPTVDKAFQDLPRQPLVLPKGAAAKLVSHLFDDGGIHDDGDSLSHLQTGMNLSGFLRQNICNSGTRSWNPDEDETEADAKPTFRSPGRQYRKALVFLEIAEALTARSRDSDADTCSLSHADAEKAFRGSLLVFRDDGNLGVTWSHVANSKDLESGNAATCLLQRLFVEGL